MKTARPARRPARFVESLECRRLMAGQIYVSSLSGTIGQYTTDGAAVDPALVTGLNNNYPFGLVVSGQYLFISDYYSGTVAEYKTDGTPVNTSLLTGLNAGGTGPFGIAVSGTDLYVAFGNGGSTTLNGHIGKYTLGATPGTVTASNANFITGLADSGSVVVDGTTLYVTDYALGTVGSYTTAGATLDATLVTGLQNPEQTAVLGSNLYVTEYNRGRIGKYTTVGATVNADLVTGLNGPLSIGTDGTNLFVVNAGSNTVGAYTPDGTAVNANLLGTLTSPFGMAVVPAGVTFGPATAYGSGSSLGIATADMNGDGLVDVISPNSATSTGDGVSVFLNAGGGTLGTPTSYTTRGAGPGGYQPYALAAADFNGDGKADIASANFESGGAFQPFSVSLLFGDGAGALGAPTNTAVGLSPDGVLAVDLTNGGLPDVVVANRGSNSISVLSNNDGVLAAAVDYPVGQAPSNIATGDFNGDGKPDLAVSNAGDDTLSLLLNNGDGTFAPATSLAVGFGQNFVAVADMNKDGRPDLVVSDFSVSLAVFLGTGGGTFGPAIRTLAGEGVNNLAVADFDGDGTPDVAVANRRDSTVEVLTGNGDGTLRTPVTFATNLIAWDVTTADLDGNGKPDLIVGSYNPGGTTPAFVTLLNFSTPATTPTPTPTPTVTKTIGGLDPGFGTNGLASHNVGFTATTGVAADGAAGSILIGPVGASPNQAFGVTRYTTTGDLDTAFGTAGVVNTTFAGGDAVPTDVVVMGDGRILVAGTVTTAGGSQFAVAKYNADGSPLTTFGTNGQVVFGFGATLSHDVLRAMAVGANGVIYLAGRSDAAGTDDMAVARLTAAGALDIRFATDGTSLFDVAKDADVANGIAVQPNGAVVVAGSAVVGGTTQVALARLLDTGLPDRRFGVKGVATAKVNGIYDTATSVALQPRGQIVVGGLTATGSAAAPSSDFLVQRFAANGRIDRSFNRTGSATTPFGQPSAVTQVLVQADGAIVASGRTSASLGGTLDVAVARYTTKGLADTTFNKTGKVVVSLTTGVVASPAAAVSLGAAFDAFVTSQQGVVAATQGGEILVAGNSGANTVEAQLIAAGVDLATKLLSALPASAVAGRKVTVLLRITEAGTDRAAGVVSIVISFAPTAAGTGATTAKTMAQRVGLKAGQSRTVRVKVAYPTALAGSGPVYLLATVTNGAGLATDLNATDNRAVSTGVVTIK